VIELSINTTSDSWQFHFPGMKNSMLLSQWPTS